MHETSTRRLFTMRFAIISEESFEADAGNATTCYESYQDTVESICEQYRTDVELSGDKRHIRELC